MTELKKRNLWFLLAGFDVRRLKKVYDNHTGENYPEESYVFGQRVYPNDIFFSLPIEELSKEKKGRDYFN